MECTQVAAEPRIRLGLRANRVLPRAAADPKRTRGRYIHDWHDVREKPEGGFAELSPGQLLLVTWCRLSGLISALDFRVWFAAVEVFHWRRNHDGVMRCDNAAEWSMRLGGVGWRRTREALSHLNEIGLLSWSRDSLSLIQSPEQLNVEDLSEYWTLLRQAGKAASNNRRLGVPVPHFIVRHLARPTGRGEAAAVVGVLLRCMRRRKNRAGDYQCVSGGFLSADYIVRTFGVGKSTVRAAFRRLSSDEVGWLKRLDTAKWVQEGRDEEHGRGAKTLIDLSWKQPVDNSEDARASVEANARISGPRSVENAPISGPPYITQRNTPSEYKHYKEPWPDARGVSTEKGFEKKPTLQHVERRDLEDSARLYELTEDACRRGIISGSEHERQSMFVLAVHCLGQTDPGRLFAWRVRNRKRSVWSRGRDVPTWDLVSGSDQERGCKRLSEFYHGVEPREKKKPEPRPKRVELKLSKEAAAAGKVLSLATQYRVEPFYLFRQVYADATRETFEHAVAEFQNARLLRLRSVHGSHPSCGGKEGGGDARRGGVRAFGQLAEHDEVRSLVGRRD